MGGGGTQSSESSTASFFNPSNAVIANLFGSGVGIGRGGGFTTTSTPQSSATQIGQFAEGGFAPRVFGPQSFSNLGDYLTNAPVTGEAALNLTGLGALGAQAGTGSLLSALGPTFDLATTGSPVNVDALVKRGVSDVAEQFQGITGLFSSDLMNAAGRNAAELRIGAEEAAQGRRLQALPLLQTLATSATSLPISGATDLLNLGENLTGALTPGGRQLGFLGELAGLQPTSAVTLGGGSKGKTTSVL